MLKIAIGIGNLIGKKWVARVVQGIKSSRGKFFSLLAADPCATLVVYFFRAGLCI